MNDDFEIVIGSAPDRDNLVAEIWFDGEQWAELSNEGGLPLLEIFAARAGTWSLAPDRVIAAVESAKSQLLTDQEDN